MALCPALTRAVKSLGKGLINLNNRNELAINELLLNSKTLKELERIYNKLDFSAPP